MTDLDPELAARLRDLADARVRAEIARAAQAREAAAEQRAAQARRRTFGVNARNATKAARNRLTQLHNHTEENPMHHDDVNAQMDSLTVAASGLITDYSDIQVRGYLKDDLRVTALRVDLLAGMVDEVRQAVAKELAGAPWPVMVPDAAEEHMEDVAEYAAHTCACEHCFHATLGYDPDAPIITAITLTDAQAAAFHAQRDQAAAQPLPEGFITFKPGPTTI